MKSKLEEKIEYVQPDLFKDTSTVIVDKKRNSAFPYNVEMPLTNSQLELGFENNNLISKHLEKPLIYIAYEIFPETRAQRDINEAYSFGDKEKARIIKFSKQNLKNCKYRLESIDSYLDTNGLNSKDIEFLTGEPEYKRNNIEYTSKTLKRFENIKERTSSFLEHYPYLQEIYNKKSELTDTDEKLINKFAEKLFLDSYEYQSGRGKRTPISFYKPILRDIRQTVENYHLSYGKQIRLMGDIPVTLSSNSASVYYFMLNAKNYIKANYSDIITEETREKISDLNYAERYY